MKKKYYNNIHTIIKNKKKLKIKKNKYNEKNMKNKEKRNLTLM